MTPWIETLEKAHLAERGAASGQEGLNLAYSSFELDNLSPRFVTLSSPKVHRAGPDPKLGIIHRTSPAWLYSQFGIRIRSHRHRGGFTLTVNTTDN